MKINTDYQRPAHLEADRRQRRRRKGDRMVLLSIALTAVVSLVVGLSCGYYLTARHYAATVIQFEKEMK